MSVLVQTQLLKLAQRVDPKTKSDQTFTDLSAAVNISSSTNANPIVITTAAPHGRSSGDQVYVTGHTVNTNANNTAAAPNWYILVVDSLNIKLYTDSALSIGVAGNGVGGATGTITSGLVGSIDGSRFTRQRLLDIYNDARLNFIAFVGETYPEQKRMMEFSGVLTLLTNYQFAGGVGAKPPGYFSTVYLTDANNATISVQSANDIPMLRANESASNRMVFEVGPNLQTISGNTLVPDGSRYQLLYYGFSNFALSDVLGGVTVETMNDDYQGMVLECAEALANDVDQATVNALTKKMIDAVFKESKGGST